MAAELGFTMETTQTVLTFLHLLLPTLVDFLYLLFNVLGEMTSG